MFAWLTARSRQIAKLRRVAPVLRSVVGADAPVEGQLGPGAPGAVLDGADGFVVDRLG